MAVPGPAELAGVIVYTVITFEPVGLPEMRPALLMDKPAGNAGLTVKVVGELIQELTAHDTAVPLGKELLPIAFTPYEHPLTNDAVVIVNTTVVVDTPIALDGVIVYVFVTVEVSVEVPEITPVLASNESPLLMAGEMAKEVGVF